MRGPEEAQVGFTNHRTVPVIFKPLYFQVELNENLKNTDLKAMEAPLFAHDVAWTERKIPMAILKGSLRQKGFFFPNSRRAEPF